MRGWGVPHRAHPLRKTLFFMCPVEVEEFHKAVEVGNVDLRRPFLIKEEKGLAGVVAEAELQQQLSFFETSFKKSHGEKSSGRGLAVVASTVLEKWMNDFIPKRAQQHRDCVVEVKTDVHGAKISDEAGASSGKGK